MSERKDMLDGSEAASADTGLIYTEVLGWIDEAIPEGMI